MQCAQLGVDLNGGLLCSIALSLTRHAFCRAAAAAAASFFERLAELCTRFGTSRRGPNHLLFMTIPAIKCFAD